MYLWPQSSSMEGMHDGFGVMTTYRNGSIALGIQEGRKFAVDNRAFVEEFNPKKFFGYLARLKPYMDNCLFIVCPDVVGDARLTIRLWHEWSDRICEYGPVAFVAQDMQEEHPFPDGFDWLFIGGTTDWKMSKYAKECIARTNKPVHVGRVNSISRFRYFQKLGVDSVDGTNPIYEPDVARRRWTNAVSQLPFRFLISNSDSSS